MCLYGFIPVVGGSYPPIHHPALCPDSSLHWQPHSHHSFYCWLSTDIWTCFHPNTPLWFTCDSLKVEWVAEPVAIVEPVSLTCSAFVQHLQSSSCMIYQSLHLLFLSLPLFFLSLPPFSSFTQLPPPYEPGSSQGFLLLFGQTLGFCKATWDGLDFNGINKDELNQIVS